MRINLSGKHLFFYLTIPVISFLLLSFRLQDDPISKISAAFQQYLSTLPEEKVYLHQDRVLYAPGETIWFKAYLTQGPFHQPSALSHTLYVELIDRNNRLVQREILYAPDGFASGHLQLADSLVSGEYLLRAYTQWMRNFGEAYFFQRSITVLSEFAEAGLIGKGYSDVDLQFFPEGGDLVEGVFSKVAFKAIGANGLGKKVKGEIYANERLVTTF